MARWIDRLVEYARVKRGVMTVIEASAWQELYGDQHERLDAALGRLLDEGKASGEVRPDVDVTDMLLLLGALSRNPAAEWDARSRKVVAMVVDGLRAR